MEVEEEVMKDELIVEKILDERIKKGKFEYLVKWKNYDNVEDTTWEPVENIGAYQNLIDAFEKSLMANKKEQDLLDRNGKEKAKKNIATKEAKSNTAPKAAKKKGSKKTEKTKPKNEGDSAEVHEDVYIIESLLKKNGSKFLVKWENYSEEYNTWEPKSSIPDFIVKVTCQYKRNLNVVVLGPVYLT
jgi:hypothetical protein